METPECRYYGENCGVSLDNWVMGDWFLSCLANFAIALVAAGILVWLIWFLFFYLRRDLCVDCFNGGKNKRTKYSYRGTPVCYYHYGERQMAGESTYLCSKHNVPYDKQRRSGITIDICPEGCIFLDDGELATLESVARSSGQSTGMVIGMAIG